MYPAVTMPDGNAIIAIPTIEEMMLIMRPISDMGYFRYALSLQMPCTLITR